MSSSLRFKSERDTHAGRQAVWTDREKRGGGETFTQNGIQAGRRECTENKLALKKTDTETETDNDGDSCSLSLSLVLSTHLIEQYCLSSYSCPLRPSPKLQTTNVDVRPCSNRHRTSSLLNPRLTPVQHGPTQSNTVNWYQKRGPAREQQ